jgi:hypothetical protein
MKALSLLGVVLMGAASVMFVSGSSSAAEPGDAPASLVEDFSYPGADGIRTEPRNYGLKLFKGDGHILFVRAIAFGGDGQCANNEIQVEKNMTVSPFGVYYCFRATSSTGFLTLEVPATFGIRGGDRPLEATAELPEGDKTFQIPAGTPVPIEPGEGNDLPPAILVELRMK